MFWVAYKTQAFCWQILYIRCVLGIVHFKEWCNAFVYHQQKHLFQFAKICSCKPVIQLLPKKKVEMSLKEIRHTAHTLSRQYMLSTMLSEILLHPFLSIGTSLIIKRRNDTLLHVSWKLRMFCAICSSLMLHMVALLLCIVMINITRSFQSFALLAFIN